MKEKRKAYTAPAAELILLAPTEALAASELTPDDRIALNTWGDPVLGNNTASAMGGNSTYWAENGKIIKK